MRFEIPPEAAPYLHHEGVIPAFSNRLKHSVLLKGRAVWYRHKGNIKGASIGHLERAREVGRRQVGHKIERQPPTLGEDVRNRHVCVPGDLLLKACVYFLGSWPLEIR